MRKGPAELTAEVIATGFGTGLAPIAPATFGSAAALLIYWALPIDGSSPWLWVMIAVAALVGTWATGRIARPEAPDPKRGVADEFAGMWVTLLFLPVTWPWLAAAFFTFRLLDIAKPFYIRRLERLPGGVGIMADDLAAGAVGALL
ncbi:MAG: phosphatidylglycerophosphatase A, partial [Dehalococcoidia bacterium]